MTICDCPCHTEHKYDDDTYAHTEYCNVWRKDVDGEFVRYWESLTHVEQADIRRRMGQGD